MSDETLVGVARPTTQTDEEPTERAKLSFIFSKVSGYVGYIIIMMWTLNGGAGAIVKYLLAQGVEWIEMSTFGTAIVGLGLLFVWFGLQRGIDKIFSSQFNLDNKKKRE